MPYILENATKTILNKKPFSYQSMFTELFAWPETTRKDLLKANNAKRFVSLWKNYKWNYLPKKLSLGNATIFHKPQGKSFHTKTRWSEYIHYLESAKKTSWETT